MAKKSTETSDAKKKTKEVKKPVAEKTVTGKEKVNVKKKPSVKESSKKKESVVKKTTKKEKEGVVAKKTTKKGKEGVVKKKSSVKESKKKTTKKEKAGVVAKKTTKKGKEGVVKKKPSVKKSKKKTTKKGKEEVTTEKAKKPIEKIKFPMKRGALEIKAPRKKKPRFVRQELSKLKKLKDKWRAPKGVDSKKAEGKRGKGKMPKIGYKNPDIIRGVHPSGFYSVMVHNVGGLNDIDPLKDAAMISATVGRKKRNEIIKSANELKITILNPRKGEV